MQVKISKLYKISVRGHKTFPMKNMSVFLSKKKYINIIFLESYKFFKIKSKNKIFLSFYIDIFCFTVVFTSQAKILARTTRF